MSSTVTVIHDVPVTMRDGIQLRADLYQPAGEGPWPVLLTRTPYGKSARPVQVEGYKQLAAAGFLVVVQDVRGRFASEGFFRPYHDDIRDGYDSIEWAARLPGTTGVVGMFGISYLGTTQWLAAASGHPALRAIFPVMSGPNLYEGRTYYGGAFQLDEWLSWSISQALETASRHTIDAPELRAVGELLQQAALHFMAGDLARARRYRATAEERLYPWLRQLPLSSLTILADLAPHYYEWLAHPDYDAYWDQWQVERRFHLLNLPAFQVAGWYDVRLRGNLLGYTGLRARAQHPTVRRGQRLLVGPWAHGPLGRRVGEADFGPAAVLDLLPLQQRWFDHWLKGIDTGLLDEPPVRLFVMGINHWRDAEDWPLPQTHYIPYYFHSHGRANTRSGDGWLSPERPGDEPPDHYTYDPADPVPSIGGKTLPSGITPGVFDQGPVEDRPDVLCYTSPVLTEPLEITGPLTVTLYAASSATDTDWTAKLVEVGENSYVRTLQEGILRASRRVSGAAPSPIKPGEVYEYTLDLWATSNVFLPGTRIRVEISSSNFPHWDRNPNTGYPPAPDGHTQPAHQTVFHDRERPSCILLPVIPGNPGG